MKDIFAERLCPSTALGALSPSGMHGVQKHEQSC